MNTPVEFSTAKLLKEKGFDKPCIRFYNGKFISYKISDDDGLKSPYIDTNKNVGMCLDAPTIAEAIMWLYEKHGIWVFVDWMTRTKPFNSGFYSNLKGTTKPLNQDNFISINNTKSPGYEVFNSPTEAYEAAIKYCLEKII